MRARKHTSEDSDELIVRLTAKNAALEKESKELVMEHHFPQRRMALWVK
ncbi:hypothetical protein AB0C95_31330 [Streptomyces caniferus]